MLMKTPAMAEGEGVFLKVLHSGPDTDVGRFKTMLKPSWIKSIYFQSR